MTTFTKASNIIFRTSIAAAFGLAAAVVVKGGNLLHNVSGVVDVSNNLQNIKVDPVAFPLSDVLNLAHILPLLLLAAVVLSCLAFRCSGKGAAILRTLVLLGTAGSAALSSFILDGANAALLQMNGAATAAQIERAKGLMDAFTLNGSNTLDAAITSATLVGVVLTAAMAAVLGFLVVTSVVSIVKTVKAGKTAECMA